MIATAIRQIFNADNGDEARERLVDVGQRLRSPAPKVARLLEDAAEDLLAFYSFPAEHWPKLRSTNPLERVNEEIGRRSDVIGTVAEKAAAAQWAGYYNFLSANAAKVAAVHSAAAATSTALPDPTVSKVAAVGFGLAAAYSGYKAADFNELAVQQGIVNRDPSDPKWRTIVTPLKTWPNRVPAVPSPSNRQQAAVHTYFAAVLGNTADDWCVGTAINRASTALSQGNVRVAKAQYRAGARCAAASMRFEATLPRLTRAANGPLTRLLRHIGSPALMHLVSAREHSAAFRRKVAAREIALIRRVIALPTSALAQMQATIANTVATPASASAVAQSLLSSTSSDAASALLEKQSAQVLAASG